MSKSVNEKMESIIRESALEDLESIYGAAYEALDDECRRHYDEQVFDLFARGLSELIATTLCRSCETEGERLLVLLITSIMMIDQACKLVSGEPL